MTPEGKVKKKVRVLLDARKPACWYFMAPASVFGRAGIPDFIGVYKGEPFAIETKAGRNSLTALQKMEEKRMLAAGVTHMVIREDTVYRITEWFDYVDREEEWDYELPEGIG